MNNIDISRYANDFSLSNKLYRLIWNIFYIVLFKTSPVPLFFWRRYLLRIFGARVGKNVSIYPSTRIWSPRNLDIGNYGCLSHYVDCYNPAAITIGPHATVSQYSFLCTATHDITDPHMRLITAPINIKEGSWVCADVFIGPGVTVGEGAVAGACSVILSDVEPWSVVAGNPAKFIKKRTLTHQE
jgi:putative colanic acid biosynthesis acetyltransferase WcaF